MTPTRPLAMARCWLPRSRAAEIPPRWDAVYLELSIIDRFTGNMLGK